MSLVKQFTQARPDFAKMEEDVISFWEETDAFKQSVEQRPSDKRYVFYDGPPFATGLPHYGHIVASTTKDVIPRYWTMKGYRVERQWGWDCHGLPIENIIEKELGLKDKAAIEAFGVEKFNEACRSAVLRYAAEWKTFIRRLGRWVDMEHDYKTMDPWFMESLWWVFKELWERDLIYRGHKAMQICPRCSTPLSNFEVTQGYKDVKDIAVFVAFKVTNAAEVLGVQEPVSMVAWTTTPWTLPGNMLLAVKPDETYVLYRQQGSDMAYIVAKKRLGAVTEVGLCDIQQEFQGKDLVGLTYEPLFPYYEDTPRAFRVVAAGFVTMEEGSGVVHIAPAFGADDYAVGRQEDIPFVQHVGMDGRFKPEVTDFAGLLVKPKDAPLETDIKILKYLQERGSVVKKENITHSYPHCWRCDTPLINYATASWFVKVTHIKSELLKNNEAINWVPDTMKHGRFGRWLENAIDWAISRNRYWGTPLPIWQAEDGDTICVGSVAELEELCGQKVDDLHKHIVDKLVIERNGKTYKRIPEVLDCWFESGSMPYASFHYPFENKEKFETTFPAEFISEGQDQTRGWFYTLHVLATALTMGQNPSIPVEHTTSSFKNVIVNGIVLAEDGKKMSKRLQNYPDPNLVANKYGMDSLRFYLMSSPVMHAENLNFSEKGVHEVQNKLVNTLWNTYGFYALYVKRAGNEAKLQIKTVNYQLKTLHVLDRWLLSSTARLVAEVTAAMDSYDVVTAARLLLQFVDAFSTWYLRLSRERLKDGTDEAAAVVFSRVLVLICKLLAPFTPFITETIYQNMTDSNVSIHLSDWPKIDDLKVFVDEELELRMAVAREVVGQVNATRKAQGLKVRQPLAKLTITSPLPLTDEITAVIAAEANVESVVWNQGEVLSVELDTNITPELKRKGQMREAIRQIQDMRKAANIAVSAKVDAWLLEWPEEWETQIKQKTLVNELHQGEPKVMEVQR